MTLDYLKITVIDAFVFTFAGLLVLTALAPLGEWRSGRESLSRQSIWAVWWVVVFDHRSSTVCPLLPDWVVTARILVAEIPCTAVVLEKPMT